MNPATLTSVEARLGEGALTTYQVEGDKTIHGGYSRVNLRYKKDNIVIKGA